MIKGMYRSASGMLPRIQKQEAIANNIANAGTTGFKRDIAFTREMARAEEKLAPKKSDWQMALTNNVHIDYTPGVFDKTDNQYDLAIEGDGFFTLQDDNGTNVFTRSGSFVVDNEGYLALPGGFRLLGDSGPLQVGNGQLAVGLTGEIEVDGLAIGRIVPQSIADLNNLVRLGGSLFAVPEDEELLPPISATVRQGYLETSNVNVVAEMVDMITAYRTYEANARALQTQDSSLDHLLNKVAGNR